MKKVEAIEGLRGYLALLVVLEHVILFTGTALRHPLIGRLEFGTDAVRLFMAISGYVIAGLLESKHETYLAYITRRFFRIYPIFLLMLLVSVAIYPIHIADCVKLSDVMPVWYQNVALDRYHTWNLHWPLHLLIALTLLHGLIPDAILPHATTAYLGQAWSLSLEWQFYLLAPLLLYPFRKASLKGLLVLCGIAIAMHYVYPNTGAALPNHIHYFLIGIGSFYFLLPYLQGKSRFSNEFISLLVCLIPVGVILLPKQLLVFTAGWLFLLIEIVYESSSGGNRFPAMLLTNRIARFLGRISYGIYLNHIAVLTLVMRAFLMMHHRMRSVSGFVAVLSCTGSLSIMLGAVTYQFVEKPGIQLGRRLAGWLQPAHGPTPIGAQTEVQNLKSPVAKSVPTSNTRV